MRPSTKPTGAVWRLLKEWRDNSEWRPNQSQMASAFGVSTSLLSNWKYMQSTMQADDMELIADKTGIDVGLIARAVAEDRRRGEDVVLDLAARRNPKRPPRGPREQRGD